ncbi:copper resistance protein CopC [Actinoplanes sp. NEAU-A12]|uniref:Copper resistance protein CopC n=1 Tax=Actinoplanes sandaracinus TaxID=3045177 RepID=A0ABT6WS51_9ACTN|nr:copper resistance CopC family protein [Actinoplanes sandaracinus]MDI6102573.1 copper resistance protein CopC [Actinoplanes sandaracinus]
MTGVPRSLLALAALLFVLVPGVPAWAHNALAEASPAKNATLKKAPSEVRLRFLQKLDPTYTTITVSNAAKEQIATSAPAVDEATGVVTLAAPLTNGVYTVAYQVVSTDGHTVKGSYQFTVDDPAPALEPGPAVEKPDASAAAPSASVTAETGPSRAAAASSTTTTIDIIPIIIAGVVVLLAVAAVFLFLRRRKA